MIIDRIMEVISIIIAIFVPFYLNYLNNNSKIRIKCIKAINDARRVRGKVILVNNNKNEIVIDDLFIKDIKNKSTINLNIFLYKNDVDNSLCCCFPVNLWFGEALNVLIEDKDIIKLEKNLKLNKVFLYCKIRNYGTIRKKIKIC